MEHRLDFYIVGFQWCTSWERVACVEHQAEPLYKIGKKKLKGCSGYWMWELIDDSYSLSYLYF